MDEPLLIREAQRGDLGAFNTLVLAYQSRALNLAYRILGEAAPAEDVAQEAFVSAFRSLASYRGGSFRAWLLRIVTNASYDELRRRKRRPSVSLDSLNEQVDSPDSEAAESVAVSTEESPEHAAERSELARALERCLADLPLEFRTVALLVDVQGFDYGEASEVIRAPVGTVKSRLARARARMRDCLQAHGELLPASLRLEGGPAL
jgi:RNA polymerase sigma-70 factor (ECF subfamily)